MFEAGMTNAGLKGAGRCAVCSDPMTVGPATDAPTEGDLPTAPSRITGRRLGRSDVSWARVPLLVFGITYGLTCLLGAVLMLAGVHDFNVLYRYFSGTPVAHLSDSQALIDLVLLLGAPAALWAGYELGLAARLPSWAPGLGLRVRRDASDGRLDAPSWLPILVFYGFTAVAVISIVHSGSLHSLSAWLNYKSWIAAREQAFQHMRFFQFVNIYILVPLAAAWVVVAYPRPGKLGLLLRWLPLLVTFGIDVLLFQKKTAIVSLLIVMFAWVLAMPPQRRRRVTRGATLTAIATITIYIATVVVPVYSKASNASICGISGITCHGGSGVPAIVAYTVLAPLTRSAAPALYYPLIFPHHHGFYPFRSLFALDILGIGTFPNDNQVVWHFMNPNIAGTTQVPFQFTLYSQGGLATALIGSAMIGLLLALSWRFVRSGTLPRPWSALAGSLALLLAVYLALDSVRNSTLVSYGIGWGVLFIGIAIVAVRFGNGPLGARPGADSRVRPTPVPSANGGTAVAFWKS
jgi:hypothetical protein